MDAVIKEVGPWIGLVGGLFAALSYLTMVTQVKTRLDMFITEQRLFREEITGDLDKLGSRLERAIDRIVDNSAKIAIVETRMGVDGGIQSKAAE